MTEVVRLRKAGKWNEIQALHLIRAYADIIVRVEAEPDNKPDLRRRDYIQQRFTNHILNLDALLLKHNIPVILYLRVHARLSTPIRVPMLATSFAINQFTDWIDMQATEQFSAHEDFKDYLRSLASWQSDSLKRLLEEWNSGHAYLDKAVDGSILIDRSTAALVEMNHLPGACLMTIPEVMEMYNAGTLPGDVSEKIELSLSLLRQGDNHKRFYAEIGRR